MNSRVSRRGFTSVRNTIGCHPSIWHPVKRVDVCDAAHPSLAIGMRPGTRADYRRCAQSPIRPEDGSSLPPELTASVEESVIASAHTKITTGQFVVIGKWALDFAPWPTRSSPGRTPLPTRRVAPVGTVESSDTRASPPVPAAIAGPAAPATATRSGNRAHPPDGRPRYRP